MGARHRKPSLPPSHFLAAVSGALRAPPIPYDDGGLRAGALFEEPARLDGMLFDASSVSCDADEADAIFQDDVEFHHGTDGLSVAGRCGKTPVDRPPHARRIAASPTRSFPAPCALAPSRATAPCRPGNTGSTSVAWLPARWRNSSTYGICTMGWRLARVFSFDHHAIDASR